MKLRLSHGEPTPIHMRDGLVSLYGWLIREGYTDLLRAPMSTCNCPQCKCKRAAGLKNEATDHRVQR